MTGITPSSTPPCAATFVDVAEVDDTVALKVFATVFASDEDAMMAVEPEVPQFDGEMKENKTKVKKRTRIKAISHSKLPSPQFVHRRCKHPSM